VNDRMVIILPPDGEAGWRWLRLSDDGRVVARGEGAPAGGEAEAPIAATVIVPAATVGVHWLTLPTRSAAQAAAAARTELANMVLTPLASQHVAVGMAAPDGRVPVAVVPLADHEADRRRPQEVCNCAGVGRACADKLCDALQSRLKLGELFYAQGRPQ